MVITVMLFIAVVSFSKYGTGTVPGSQFDYQIRDKCKA